MIRLFLAALAALSLSLPTATLAQKAESDPTTVAGYLELYSRGGEDRDLALILINSYAEGSNWNLTFAAEAEMPVIYCPPPYRAVSAQENHQILVDFVTASPIGDEMRRYPLAMIMIMALMDEFPCERG